VTAAFDLALKLKMAAEQRVLVGRLQQLGAQGRGGVALISIDDIVKMMQERREQVERTFELYANGRAGPCSGEFSTGSAGLYLSWSAPQGARTCGAPGDSLYPLRSAYGGRPMAG
jgi:hypothetical protein